MNNSTASDQNNVFIQDDHNGKIDGSTSTKKKIQSTTQFSLGEVCERWKWIVQKV